MSCSIHAMKDSDVYATEFASTTAGLQAAIDYLSGGKGKVFVGPGTLEITDATTLASNITLEGAGNNATVFQRSSSALGVNVFTGTTVSNVIVRDVGFDNNSLAVTDDDMEFSTACSNITIEGCRWINLTNRAASLAVFNTSTGDHHRYVSILNNAVVGGTTTDTYNSFRVFCASDVDVSGNVIDGWGAIKIEQSSTSTAVMRRIAVCRNRFLNVDQTHIFVRPAGSTEIEDVTVADNVGSLSSSTVLKGMVNVGENTTGSGAITRNVSIRGNCGRGHQGHFINLAGVNGTIENATVCGNTFDGRYDGSSTISATSESSGINCTTTCKRVTVVGNTIRYTGRSGIRGALDHGVVANNVTELTAQNDLAAPTPVREAGIYIFNTTANARVSDNIVLNPSNATNIASYVTGGIVVDNAATIAGVQIDNNTIIDDRGASAGMSHGIKVGIAGGGANPSAVSVRNNYISGAVTAPFLGYGTGTKWLTPLDGRGTDIASAATIAIPTDGGVFHVTGTTNITNGITVNAWDSGRTVYLVFDDILTMTDTGTSVLQGNFTSAANDMLVLACDGTNWIEASRN